MCISTGNSDSILFLGGMPLFELKNLTKIKKNTQNSFSAHLLWNRSTEFGIDMHFYRECWFDLFKEQFISILNFGQNYLSILCVSFITNLLPDWPIPPFIMVICIMCSILKQWWSVGYLSLLTFSFIAFYNHAKQPRSCDTQRMRTTLQNRFSKKRRFR